MDRLQGVTTVPLVAVQRGPEGAFAFVLKPDRTVEQRPLRLGALTATEAVVRQGIQPGERVVTSGALRLSPGAAVMPTEEGGPAPGPAPASGGCGRAKPRMPGREPGG